MLSWLRRRTGFLKLAPLQRSGGSRWHVTFDDTKIQLTQPNGSISEIAWAQLGCVGIVTTSDGPAAPDLFWLLQPQDRHKNIVIPMGADGEHEFLHAMQARLSGFDNMTVVEAMSSTDQAGFVVWQASDKRDVSVSST